MGTEGTVVFVAVVGARFLVPLFIPFPLPAIVAAWSSTASTRRSSSRSATTRRLPGLRQGDGRLLPGHRLPVDDAQLDQPAGVPVARFLYFYRLVGVVLRADPLAAVLLIFPNTFEYFFIAYEIVRLRWNPARYGLRCWVITAAAIWVFIEAARRSGGSTSPSSTSPTRWRSTRGWDRPSWLLVAGARRGRGSSCGRGCRPATGPGGWRPTRCPREIDTAAERDRWVAAHGRVLSAGHRWKRLCWSAWSA